MTQEESLEERLKKKDAQFMDILDAKLQELQGRLGDIEKRIEINPEDVKDEELIMLHKEYVDLCELIKETGYLSEQFCDLIQKVRLYAEDRQLKELAETCTQYLKESAIEDYDQKKEKIYGQLKQFFGQENCFEDNINYLMFELDTNTQKAQVLKRLGEEGAVAECNKELHQQLLEEYQLAARADD